MPDFSTTDRLLFASISKARGIKLMNNREQWQRHINI